MSVEMIGPFERTEYVVTIDGLKVPKLTAYPRNPQQTEWTLLLDGRIALDLSEELLNQVVSFVADAIAVGAGWGAFSHACEHQGERHNPFGTRMTQLGFEEPQEPIP